MAVITEQDLNAAIAECQGKRNPDSGTCIKLAAFYTIKNELFGSKETPGYSYAPAPEKDGAISYHSGTEFGKLVSGREQSEIFPVLDELMDTLEKMQPRLYNMVMDRLQ